MSAPETAVIRRASAVLQAEAEAPPEPRRLYICFRAGGEWLALPIRRVREVQVLPPMARVPNAPPEILGIVNLRGRVLTLLSLAAALGVSDTAAPTHCLVLDLGELDPYVGLAIHGVHEVLSIPLSAIQPPPASGDRPPGLAGVFEAGGHVVGLLDVARVYGRLLAEWGIVLDAPPTH
jgi:purine-binding chemotaxis protein CheW